MIPVQTEIDADRPRPAGNDPVCNSLKEAAAPGGAFGSGLEGGNRGRSPEYLSNVIRIITETGLRVSKELMPMKNEQVDLDNAVAWIPGSKTPKGLLRCPLMDSNFW